MTESNYKNVLYPPGGILLWLIIMVELVTFGAALIVMVSSAHEDGALFHESRMHLDVRIGTINTVLLLTSGYFMANVVHLTQSGKRHQATSQLLMTLLFGLLFLILKSVEYVDKIQSGLGLMANAFFTFYWMLTLFHVLHVVAGLVILAFIYRTLSRSDRPAKPEDVASAGTFWHMCDLIWLILFPVIYLIF